jgi:high-affinity iron transporter
MGGLSLVLAAAAALAAPACAGSEERGRQLYAAHGCAVCHGASGRGDGPTARRLDAPPPDLANVGGYRQGASQRDIAASIRGGVGAMPAFRDITESEASDMAAWIVSLRNRVGGTGGQR